MPKSTLAENYRYKKTVTKGTLINGQALLLDSYVVKKILRSVQHEGKTWDPNYTLGLAFLDQDFL